jgi:L-fucose mutarotase
MLKTKLLHPEILRSLATAGHGSNILIADGNYPFSTHANPQADRVYLNLAPGLLSVTQVLEVLLTAIHVEEVHVMIPRDGDEPPIYEEFRKLLPFKELERLGRLDFYDLAIQSETSLVIATGEQRLFSNIMLTIGVVSPPA